MSKNNPRNKRCSDDKRILWKNRYEGNLNYIDKCGLEDKSHSEIAEMAFHELKEMSENVKKK